MNKSMDKFSASPEKTKKSGILKRVYRKLTKPYALSIIAALGIHGYIADEAIGHLARKTGLEALMVITNQSRQSKTILRNDFALTEERKVRRFDAMKRNKPEYDQFIKRIKPVLDGTLASADRLKGDFAIDNLLADFEKLTLGVNPQTIQLGRNNLQIAFKDIDEEKDGTKITRDLLHFTLDRIAPGKTFELTRSSSFESMAMNFDPYTQNCDARNSILFITLDHLDPEALKHTYIQQFVDHLRVIYEINENKYILEPGVNRFPDEVTLRSRSALIPAAGYLAYRLTGKSISNLEGVQYFGKNTIFSDEVKLAITDLNLSYYKAMDIAKLATDFSGFGFYNSSQTNESNTISYRQEKFIGSKDKAKIYPDEVGETEEPPKTPSSSKNDNDKVPTSPIAELPPAISTPHGQSSETGLTANRLSDKQIDAVLEVRNQEQAKIERAIVSIEQENIPSTDKSSNAIFELTLIYPKTLTFAKFEQKFRKITEQDLEGFIKFLPPDAQVTFRKKMFDEKRNLRNPSQFIPEKNNFGPEAQLEVQKVRELLSGTKIDEYTSIETPALIGLIEKGFLTEEPTISERRVEFTSINLTPVQNLSADNVQALILSPKLFSLKLSSLNKEGFDLILSQKKPFQIIVDSDLGPLISEGQQGNCDYLRFIFSRPRLDVDTSKKLAELNIKIYMLGVVIKKPVAWQLSKSKKPIVIPGAEYLTAKLVQDIFDELGPGKNMPQVGEIVLSIHEIDEEIARIVAKYPDKNLRLAAVNLLRPEIAAIVNRQALQDYTGLKVLTPKTVAALKGSGDLNFMSDVLTPENLAAFNENGKETNSYPKIIIWGGTLDRELLSNYRFQRMCNSTPDSNNAKRCRANKKLLDKTTIDLSIIDALIGYKGDIELTLATLPYELFHKFYARSAKTHFRNLRILVNIPAIQFNDEKDRIKAEIASYYETIQFKGVILIINEGIPKLSK